ncbi:Uncharacterised protein [Bordetella pertussis]|nr:Uncharacterised protein [Bordetella pertussis]
MYVLVTFRPPDSASNTTSSVSPVSERSLDTRWNGVWWVGKDSPCGAPTTPVWAT